MTSEDAYFHSERLNLRLPPPLLTRIDAHVAHFQHSGPPGFRVTRAAVIRGLLMHALDQAEAERALAS
jgi:hypothetical protein